MEPTFIQYFIIQELEINNYTEGVALSKSVGSDQGFGRRLVHAVRYIARHLKPKAYSSPVLLETHT